MQSNGDLYAFRYEWRSANWVVYVEHHPENPIGGWCDETHILGGGLLCISSGSEPKTLEQAISRSFGFMHYFSNYIRTGSTEQLSVRIRTPDYNEDGTTRKQ